MVDELRLDRTNTAIVVDSTADLSAGLAADPNLSMVPLNVHFGEASYCDWVDMQPGEFYERLKAADSLPTTSQPSPAKFLEEYKKLRTQFERIYSIHLTSKLSGTFESATAASKDMTGITVIDTGLVSQSGALLARQLLEMLDAGTSHDEIMTYVDRFRRESGIVFILDTLEYLQKGGRIGKAAGLVGSMLHMKPLLTFNDGIVDTYKKVRGGRKAMAAMQEYFLEKTTPGARVAVAIAHAAAPHKIDEVLELLKQTDRDVHLVLRGEVGSVIGTYAGPDAVALFFIEE